jgi:RNA polymerase sigma-70 factor (ECF subfamily)
VVKPLDPDRDLVLGCQDPHADRFDESFERLYQKYRDRVYSIAYRMTGCSSDAMDVAQEAFSIVFRKIDAFRFDALFSTWLFRIVVNASIDYLRQSRGARRRPGVSLHTLATESEPADESLQAPLDRAADAELGAHVQSAIQRLSPKLRAVLLLRYLESQSYEDLATTLAISIGTVKSRLARAHVALENLLRGTLAPFGYPEDGAHPERVAAEAATDADADFAGPADPSDPHKAQGGANSDARAPGDAKRPNAANPTDRAIDDNPTEGTEDVA